MGIENIFSEQSSDTEKSFRNLIRCFGVDDELIKLNLYGDGVTFKFVESGAQGPHKIQRGYLPVKTYSSHYIRNTKFRSAVKDFLNEEIEVIENDINHINTKYTPYKKN